MSNLLVMPSIDIKDGKTVRVVQGIPDIADQEYGNDPVETAMLWRSENAKIIHVVDFDNSWEHSHTNFDVIADICESVVIPVEMGGGIANLEGAKEALSLGVYRLVIGTLIHENEKEFINILETCGPKRVVAAMDVIGDDVVIRGRKYKTGKDPCQFAMYLRDIGIERVIVTDVNKNGMLAGPNIELSRKIAEDTGLQVTHSGGISGYRDLSLLCSLVNKGVDSVIIGRALYENKFPCQTLWRVAESGIF